jgi:hypothetical protein
LVSESIEPIGRKDQIRVSEVGEWVYCSVAWKLRGEGVSPDYQGLLELQAGVDLHHEHGTQVGRSVAARRVKPWLLAGILIAGALLVLFLWMGR